MRTEAVLTEICQFVGVACSNEMLGYCAGAPQYPPPDPRLVAQWRTKLAPRDVALVEVRTARLMESRGYAPSGSSTPKRRSPEARAPPEECPAAEIAHAARHARPPGWSRWTCSADGLDPANSPARPDAYQRRRAEPARSGDRGRARPVREHRSGRTLAGMERNPEHLDRGDGPRHTGGDHIAVGHPGARDRRCDGCGRQPGRSR